MQMQMAGQGMRGMGPDGELGQSMGGGEDDNSN